MVLRSCSCLRVALSPFSILRVFLSTLALMYTFCLSGVSRYARGWVRSSARCRTRYALLTRLRGIRRRTSKARMTRPVAFRACAEGRLLVEEIGAFCSSRNARSPAAMPSFPSRRPSRSLALRLRSRSASLAVCARDPHPESSALASSARTRCFSVLVWWCLKLPLWGVSVNESVGGWARRRTGTSVNGNVGRWEGAPVDGWEGAPVDGRVDGWGGGRGLSSCRRP